MPASSSAAPPSVPSRIGPPRRCSSPARLECHHCTDFTAHLQDSLACFCWRIPSSVKSRARKRIEKKSKQENQWFGAARLRNLLLALSLSSFFFVLATPCAPSICTKATTSQAFSSFSESHSFSYTRNSSGRIFLAGNLDCSEPSSAD